MSGPGVEGIVDAQMREWERVSINLQEPDLRDTLLGLARAIERAAHERAYEDAQRALSELQASRDEHACRCDALKATLVVVRSGIERARFLAGTPGRRSEAGIWFADALNRIDAAIAPASAESGQPR